MRRRRPNYRLVKIHRSYTVEDVARLFGIHKNTVWGWLKVGLPAVDKRRPILILGRDLATYLRVRREKSKRPCTHGEIYCVRCRAPKRPAGNIAEYHANTASLGNLMGICPDCNGMIYRRCSKSKLPEIRGTLDVTIREVKPRVSDIDFPTLNSEFIEGENP